MNRDEVVKTLALAKEQNEIPDFSRTNLYSANLSNIDLTNANFKSAILTATNLQNVKLINANLRKANLTFSDLRGADLTRADLNEADLREADLRGAILNEVNLRKAKLQGAKFDEDPKKLAASLGNQPTKKALKSYEAQLRAQIDIFSNKLPLSPFASPILPPRWEGLEREAKKRNVPIKPLIKPVPDALRRIEKELRRIENTVLSLICLD